MQEVMYDYINRLEDRHWWFQARKNVVLSLIERYFNGAGQAKILDIGCGTGMMLNYLLKYGEAWGIDNNLRAVEYARIKCPKASIILGTVPQDLPDDKFDLITALDFIEHIYDDRGILGAMANNLKEKGILAITVPAYQSLWTSHDDLNFHKRRYLAKELKDKIEKSGLAMRKISYYNTFLFPPILAAKIFIRLLLNDKMTPHFGKNPPPRLLNRTLQSIFSSEKTILPYLDFPFGSSIIAIARKK